MRSTRRNGCVLEYGSGSWLLFPRASSSSYFISQSAINNNCNRLPLDFMISENIGEFMFRPMKENEEDLVFDIFIFNDIQL